MRQITLAAAVCLCSSAALAQADMSCADYLKADAQMQAAMTPADRAAMASDPSAAALDKKVKGYCAANPKAPTSEAMMKAMQ